ncbi:MAG: helix-turn-helix domain-containing protein [Pyrinomonadaceae bacterium]
MIVDFDSNVISFAAHGAKNVEIHRHHCFQIVASIRGTFACTIGGNYYHDKKGFIVNQNVTHSCQAENASVIVYFIDADSYFGWQLKSILAGQKSLDTEGFFTDSQMQKINAEGNQNLSKDELKTLSEEIFQTILPRHIQQNENLSDERVAKAINFIETNLAESLNLEDIADLMFLSPERARHLFAEKTGSPFSQYLLWKRIKQVIITTLLDNVSLTDASLKYGFADQSHFTRTFKKTFGMSPKTHLKNSRFVQFLNPFV